MSLARIGSVSSLPELAELLRELRRRQARQRGGPEITYRELVASTGWSIGILAGYFGGRILPPTDRFDALVTLLDATPAERGALATARDRVSEHRRQSSPDRAARPVPRQLPTVGFRFAGRTHQLLELDALLSGGTGATPTVAVLSGTAGVGKTALATHWAHRVAAAFPDGQVFVDLRGFDPERPPVSPAEALRDLLDALGATTWAEPASPAAQAGRYRSLLAGRRVLLVLDNAGDADQVRPLLPGTPGCLALVTSRNQLTGLVAVEGAHHLVLDLMPRAEAYDLLAGRLGAQRVAAEPAVADEIIDRCARLPLALAVVAARAGSRPTFPLAAVVEELRLARGGLDPFTDRDAAADARAAFACSYQHLSATAARLFRRLGGHPGPDLAAPAAASLAAVPVAQVRPALAELVEAHLLTEPAPGRYALHDLLRAFATEQARRADPPARRRATLHRLLDHYLRTACAAARLMYPAGAPVAPVDARTTVVVQPLDGPDEARAWFAAEYRVLIGAVTLAADRGLATHAWQLAWALSDFLDWRGHWLELADVARVALRAAERAGDHLGRIHAHRGLARASNRLARYDDAEAELERAIELCGTVAVPTVEATCHLNLALTMERTGRYRRALDLARRALDLFDAADQPSGYARALGDVGWYHALLGDYEAAVARCREAIGLQRTHGTGEPMPWTLDSLGYACHHLGRHDEAITAYRQAIELYRRSGDRFNEADTLAHLADALAAVGQADEAAAARRHALAILDELGHPAAAALRASGV